MASVDMRTLYMAFAVALLLVSMSYAASTTQQVYRGTVIYNASHPHATLSDLKSFMALYIPTGIINDSVYANATIGKYNYTIMQLNGSGNNYIVFNMTNLTIRNTSFVLDQNTAFLVLAPYLAAKYYPSANTIESLLTQFMRFKNQSAAPLNDCLTETGLSQFLCPVGYNTTQCLQKSCETVPICFDALQGRVGKLVVGYPTGFVAGIMNFSANYTVLNASYNSYISLQSSINQGNIGTNLQQMQSDLSSINYVATVLPQNPLFPAPTNISIQQQQNVCPQYQGVYGGPYYCYSTGFCGNPNFNFTILNSLQSQISSLLSLPISNASITTVAIASINNGASYFDVRYLANQQQKFNAIINSTRPRYLSLVANLTFLASRYQNASLQNTLSALTSTYNATINAGVNQNLTKANASINSAISNAARLYASGSAKYVPTYLLAYNSTSILLLRELDYQVPPPSLSALASQESQINIQLNNKINSSTATALAGQAASIGYQARGISPPFSLPATVKAVDGGILGAILASPATPTSVKIATAPAYAALISLVIGIVIIMLIYFGTYYRLKSKRRLNLNSAVHRAWTIVFALLFVFALIYAFATYSYAQQANQFLPVSGFVSSVSGSNSVYLLTNQSISGNALVQQCTSALRKTLSTKGITTTYVTMGATGTCTLPSNASITGTQCIDHIFASGIPAIIINPGTNSTIIYKGLYGEALYVTGSAAHGASCPLNGIFQVS